MYLNGKLIFVSLLLLVATTTSVFGAGKKHGSGKGFDLSPSNYHRCLPLPARPGYTTLVPSRQIRLFGETQTASRHHIIPFAILQKFYNLMVEENPKTKLGAHVAQSVLEMWNKFKKDERAGAFARGQENEVTIKIGGQTNPTFKVDYRMQAAYTWMPGNIFYDPSPSRRSDDPHDKFEEGSESIVGKEAFAILQRLNANMFYYINEPSNRTIELFDAIIKDLHTIDARKTPYEFKQEDWIIAGTDKHGKNIYSIKGHRHTRAIGMSEDYMTAVDRKCKDYMSQLIPKLKFLSC